MPTLYVVFDSDPGFDADEILGGRALSDHADHLEQISNSLGVKHLFEFFSIDPEEANEFAVDAGVGSNAPPEEWFAPEEGLAVAKALLEHLEGKGERTTMSEEILADLRDLQTVLEKAVEANVRWHLAVDY